MADLFGEIVHPSSRAFWDGDDEDETVGNEDLTKFTLDWIKVVPQKIKTLLIAESHLLIDFMKDYVLKNAESICHIKSLGSKNPSEIFKVTDDLYVCIVSNDVDLKLAADFVESIHDVLMKSENIIALTCNHISQMKTAVESLEPCFFKSLSTKRVPEAQKKFSLSLEQPNIVSGVSAGVVAYAEAMDLSATVNVLYLDGFELDSETVQPIINLLKNHIGLETSKFASCKKPNCSKGNLYILR